MYIHTLATPRNEFLTQPVYEPATARLWLIKSKPSDPQLSGLGLAPELIFGRSEYVLRRFRVLPSIVLINET